jgi:signal transduction histidine kinase
MRVLSSLTNRIFIGSAALAVLTIATAVSRFNAAVTTQAENELKRGLEEAGTLLEENRETLFGHFSREARLISDLSNLKAAMTTGDGPTVQPIATEYQQRIGSDLLVVTDPAGRVLAQAGRLQMPDAPTARDTVRGATEGRDVVSLWPHPGGVIQVVSVPSFIANELVGTLSVGFSLDEQTARQFKDLTNSEIAFVVDGRVQASTLPPEASAALADVAGAQGVRRVEISDSDYVAVSRTLALNATDAGVVIPPSAFPTAIILRSRTERLRFLSAVHRDLAGTAILAVLAATLVSYGVARTVTRPLATITATMREMAATGDLTRRISLPAGAWEDEDARLLATTFNAMTDSIGRFQQEAAQRERLSSLGRLSTVVAHEIRNPLMIIKTALRPLRSRGPTPEDLRAAVADIDEEIARLNRIVSDVLDFARPITFDLAETDLNALCEDAARAVNAGSALEVTRTLDPAVGLVTTDAERLRLALVNILMNARHAVMARAEPPSADAISLRTVRSGPDSVAIEVRDHGIGIAAEDLPRVFDPYFTTRRTGTGLGLAISRQIVEGLGGRISVSSHPGRGTDVGIEIRRQKTEGRRYKVKRGGQERHTGSGKRAA